mgnify:CR=1 FL=1
MLFRSGDAGGGSAVFRVDQRRVQMDSGDVDELFPFPARETLSEGAVLLRGFARDDAPRLIADLAVIIAASPFRHMIVPTGQRMSVAMTNSGTVGWVTDRMG